MPKDIGDLAAEAAIELQNEHMDKFLEDGKVVNFGDEDDVMTREKRRGPFAKLTFRWRPSDELLLEQIRAGASVAFAELFADAIKIIDNLYSAIRVPSATSEGIVRHDENGRIIWETDERGEIIHNWDQLTGQDVEEALVQISRLKLVASPRVNNLLMEALLAKRIHQEKRDDEYVAMIDGTIDDKNAKANRKSREDNYHAFFRFWLWSQGDVFLKELGNFQRVLERIRDRRIYNQD